MKKGILTIAVFLSLLFTGCFSVNEDINYVNTTWKLIETRVSIGGPAEYVPAEQEEFIEFLADSKVKNSNGWCGAGSETVVTYSDDGTINTNCQGSAKLLFERVDGFLIIRNPSCIEACDYKYERVGSRE